MKTLANNYFSTHPWDEMSAAFCNWPPLSKWENAVVVTHLLKLFTKSVFHHFLNSINAHPLARKETRRRKIKCVSSGHIGERDTLSPPIMVTSKARFSRWSSKYTCFISLFSKGAKYSALLTLTVEKC